MKCGNYCRHLMLIGGIGHKPVVTIHGYKTTLRHLKNILWFFCTVNRWEDFMEHLKLNCVPIHSYRSKVNWYCVR